MTPAAIGFRAHSGWAAAVAIAGPAEAPAVIARRRIEMVERTGPRAAQPYHAAAGQASVAAERIIGQAAASAARLAAAGLRAMLAELRRKGYEARGCGLLLAAGRPLPELPAILASHALIHTAEGELFRQALRAAGAECGLTLTTVKERELLASTPAALQQHIYALGRMLGPPWRQDQKFSALAAWLALYSGMTGGVVAVNRL
jgi:hypothetical protein